MWRPLPTGRWALERHSHASGGVSGIREEDEFEWVGIGNPQTIRTYDNCLGEGAATAKEIEGRWRRRGGREDLELDTGVGLGHRERWPRFESGRLKKTQVTNHEVAFSLTKRI